MDTFAINGSSNVEMWLNGQQIYSSSSTPSTQTDLWYGVKFVGSATDGTRTGNLDMHKSLPLQSLMKGCSISDYTNGEAVKYFNSGWTQYEDGTAMDTTTNRMVELPRMYAKYIRDDEEDSDEWRISLFPLEGFFELRQRYCGAYNGTVDENNILKSIPGSTPTVSLPRATFQADARLNGSQHWNMYTYSTHKMIAILFMVEYATRNVQKAFNNELTAEGYKQGGLGAGVTTGTITVDGATVYAYVPCGVTDALGNSTGVIEYTTTTADETNITVSVPRYRGIENPFGHIWQNTIDVVNHQGIIYYTEDYTKFGNDYSVYDKSFTVATDANLSGWVKQIVGGDTCEIFPKDMTGTNGSVYYCDYSYVYKDSTYTLLTGGNADAVSNAGLFRFALNNGLSFSYASTGSRLTYLI